MTEATIPIGCQARVRILHTVCVPDRIPAKSCSLAACLLPHPNPNMSAPTRRHRRGRFSLLPALSLLAAALAHGSALAAAQELAGVELRCCALVESPMVVKDTRGDETRFTGIAIDYLRKLELALGFRCKTLYEYGSDQAPAPDGFEGFTGFVKYIADCAKGNDTSSCMCDMGVSG